MEKNNKWRRRIIRVLENLLADLQSRPPGPTQSDVINKLAALSDRADSIMSDLGDDEIAGSLYYMKDIPIPKTDESVLYRLKGCLEDTAFAVFCGMQDATYFRLFSARAWRDFALGEIGIQTATFCTNNAYFQTGRISAQLRTMFDHLNDENWMTQMHTMIDMIMRRHIANDMDSTGTQPDDIDPDFQDISLARNAARRLGYYASSLLCSRLSTLLFEVFIAQRRLRPVDTLEDRRLLKSLAQLRCLEWADDAISETFRTDCMYEAARSLLLGHIDTDAVFAAQMLYDIQQQLNPQSVPLEDILEGLSMDYVELYENYDAEWTNEVLDGNQTARAKRMHDQYHLLRHISYSILTIQNKLELWEHDTSRYHTIRPFNILRHVPLLIGQMVAQHHEEFHDTFLDIANDRGHILAVTHLYSLVKTTGALPTEMLWVDMEWVTANHDKLHLSEGSPADTDPKYLDRFYKAFVYGLNHSNFSMGCGPAKPEQVKNNTHLAGGVGSRLESCARCIRACSEFKSLRKSKPNEWRLRMMHAFADYELDFYSAYGPPHSTGILIAAKEAHGSDEEALGFDIFAFHTICRKLMSAIGRACIEVAPDDYPGIRDDDPNGQLNTHPAEIVRALQHCVTHHERLFPSVVKLLADVIEQEGSTCTDIALGNITMTTLDSIGMDNDDSRSDTMSLSSAVSTLLYEPTKADDPESDVEVSGTSKSKIREDGEESHAAPKRLKPDRTESSSPLVSRDLDDQSERFYNDILERWVNGMLDGSNGMLDGSNGMLNGSLQASPLNGNVLEPSPSESYAGNSRATTKLGRMYSLLRECQSGRMAWEKVQNGNLLFRQDGEPKIVVVMPAIEFYVLDETTVSS